MLCASLALGVHLATYHLDRSAHLNEANLGVYAQCDDWVAGGYRNSQYRNSFYVGRVWKIGPFDVVGGAITGYTRARVLPLVAPSLKYGNARVTFIPPVDKSTGAIHFSMEY